MSRSLLRLDRQGASLTLAPNQAAAHLPLGGPAMAQLDALELWLARKRPPKGSAALVARLTTPWLQLRTLNGLPAVSERDLGLLLGQRPGRYFRLAGPVRLAAAWVARPGPLGNIAVAGAIDAAFFDGLAAVIAAAGWTLKGVEAESPCGQVTLRFGGADEPKRARASQARMVRAGLVTLLGFGLVSLVSAWVWSAQLGRRVSDDLARVAPAAGALGALKKEMAAADEAVRAVKATRARRGNALAALAALAQAMPDSAMLLSFETEGGATGRVTGRARRGMQFIASLEKGWAVRQRLEGSLIRETFQGAEWDRFAIQFGPIK